MQAEIITIGDEILIGQILDTNSRWLAEQLNTIGISVYQIVSIQDEAEHIQKALTGVHKMTDLVIFSGGLGPTNDDITKRTLTHYFEDHLVLHKETEDNIRTMFKKARYPFTEVNRQQAYVPSSCIPLLNEWGTAPGMWFEKGGKIVISLPGVPNELKGLMEHRVIPKLTQQFNLPHIVHRTVLTHGMGESMVAERISDWESALPESIKLAYLPSYGKLRLRLTTKGNDIALLEQKMETALATLYQLIPDIIVGEEGKESLETVIGQQLIRKGQSVAVAESCTGGQIAKQITSIPGASAYFKGGIIAYSKDIKVDFLGVSDALITSYSVVSKQVAEEMAKEIRTKFGSFYGVASTGNAGPTSDETSEPVGTVFLAIATPTAVYSEKLFFGKPRQKVIERASNKALEMLQKEILKNK